MTEAQRNHASYIATRARTRIFEKYATGQAEHGGNLWDKFTPLRLVEEALNEAYDQVIYLETLHTMLQNSANRGVTVCGDKVTCAICGMPAHAGPCV